MATRQLPALIGAAKAQAETLAHYRIKQAGAGFVLWRWSDGWTAVHLFPTQEAAEDYLTRKISVS